MSNFQYRYSGTFVGLPSDDVILPAKVLAADDVAVRLHVYNGENWSEQVHDLRAIDCSIPNLGMVAIGKSAFFITRKVIRGYKRGLDASTISANRITMVAKSWDRLPRMTDGPSLFAIYNPKYETVAEAERMIREKEKWAVPVNQNIAFAVHAGYGDPVVHYAEMIAGFVRDNRVVLHNKFDFVRDELALLNTEVILVGE